MAWTAKKLNPRSDGRIFRVDVQYLKDGVVNHVETYETTQDQPATWPAELVKRHIAGLQGLEALPAKITSGDVTVPGDVVVDADAQLWMQRFAIAQSAQKLVELGVILATNQKFVDLKTWLRNNFRAEYVGLV